LEHINCIIMAGGKGERFWPLSTPGLPKPFIKLFGERSMVQMTMDRVRDFVPLDRTFVVLGAEHLSAARDQLPILPDEQFIIEPEGRDTAACIGLAAAILKAKDPEAVMVVLPADHYIPDGSAFIRTLLRAIEWSQKGEFLVTIGVPPTRPEKGYGYIHAGLGTSTDPRCFRVDRFVEKPEEEKAIRYLAEGGYFWNSGIFVWKASVVLKGLERHMPGLSEGLSAIGPALAAGEAGEMERIFAGFEEKSIDYGLMEKADNVLMVTADFAWDDVGTWGSLRRVMNVDGQGNYAAGRIVSVDTEDCVIYGEDIPIGTIGISSLIVVASHQGVLVCDLGRDQEIRGIARALEDEEE
jgi:mannose-1-phosphate guanylyltransferase